MDETEDLKRKGPPHRPEVRRLVERQRRVFKSPSRDEQIVGFRGWNERGYLPHRDEPGLTQFVTFRLADSFPAELRHEWEHLLKIEDERERRVQLEAWLDLGHGACWLRDERVAHMVADALRAVNEGDCVIHAWVIMPNHVHLLFEVTAMPMAVVLKNLKGATGRAANRILGRVGQPFWQADYWDTFMRDEDHRQRTIRYVRNNPVKAGLMKEWKEWPWVFVRGEE